MKRHLIKALLLGAVVISSIALLDSCNKKDIENLDTRISVLEGYIPQLEKKIEDAVVTGATIISAVQDKDGVWTLTLSTQQVIVIKPVSGGGGGSTVTVTETDKAFIITVDGVDYVIPKAEKNVVNSLVFCAKYTDGSTDLTNDGAVLYYLATPQLSEEQVKAATWTIADARLLQTRSGQDFMVITDTGIEDGLVKISVKGIKVEASKTYNVAVRADFGSQAIGSNYAKVVVSDDFHFDSEDLVDPVLYDGNNMSKVTVEGFETCFKCDIPNPTDKFLGTFNFKELYKELPSGNITFELAPREFQNGKVQERYDFYASCLASDGTWTIQGRPGNNCWDPDKNGILIYMKSDYVIKNKIFWTIDNPVSGLGWGNVLTDQGFHGGEHIEYGCEESVNAKWMVPAGARVIDLAKIYVTNDPGLHIKHGNAAADVEIIGTVSKKWDDEEVFYSDGETLVLGDKIQPYIKHSRGLVWRCTQPSWASSIRENWTDEAKAASGGQNNGEIIGGWDGGGDIPGLMGWELNEKGLVCHENYLGGCFRTGFGLYLEYDYGEETIGPWHWFYMWINRRVCPEGVIDPQPR